MQFECPRCHRERADEKIPHAAIQALVNKHHLRYSIGPGGMCFTIHTGHETHVTDQCTWCAADDLTARLADPDHVWNYWDGKDWSKAKRPSDAEIEAAFQRKRTEYEKRRATEPAAPTVYIVQSNISKLWNGGA